MKGLRHTLVTAALFGALAWNGAASADGWPASVTGNWNIIGNQTAGVLSLAQAAGAVGSKCKPVRGTIYVVDTVEGFYCPGSGRISFLRREGNTKAPKQYWSGNLSQAIVGQPLRLGGTFAAFPHNGVSGTIGGSLGEYEWYGVK